MRLLYRDKYNIMSPSQVGARKDMNIRNHIWILNSIICDVLKNKKCAPIDLQVLDIKQCFDSLWTEECTSDLFQYGVKDSTLNLLYDACKNAQVALRTPMGLTERKRLTKRKNAIMQGDVFGPIFCATSIDRFGKECLNEDKYLYKYKGKVNIPSLSMIDDLICVNMWSVISENNFLHKLQG